MDLNFGNPAPPLRTTASLDPWGAAVPPPAPALDPWGPPPLHAAPGRCFPFMSSLYFVVLVAIQTFGLRYARVRLASLDPDPPGSIGPESAWLYWVQIQIYLA